jgi:acetolactate synthase-1/2/3 large subunit
MWWMPVCRPWPKCNNVLLGAPQPVAFFAYPGKPSTLAPAGCAIHTACSPEEDVLLALQALATALGVDRKAPLAVQAAGHIHAPTSGPLTASAVNLVALQALPEGAIVVDESITSGRDIAAHNMQAVPHDWLVITGGAIGQGIPTAVGRPLAHQPPSGGFPGRRQRHVHLPGPVDPGA